MGGPEAMVIRSRRRSFPAIARRAKAGRHRKGTSRPTTTATTTIDDGANSGRARRSAKGPPPPTPRPSPCEASAKQRPPSAVPLLAPRSSLSALGPRTSDLRHPPPLSAPCPLLPTSDLRPPAPRSPLLVLPMLQKCTRLLQLSSLTARRPDRTLHSTTAGKAVQPVARVRSGGSVVSTERTETE